VQKEENEIENECGELRREENNTKKNEKDVNNHSLDKEIEKEESKFFKQPNFKQCLLSYLKKLFESKQRCYRKNDLVKKLVFLLRSYMD